MEKPTPPKYLYYLIAALLVWVLVSPFVVTVTGLSLLGVVRELFVLAIAGTALANRRRSGHYIFNDIERLVAAITVLAVISTVFITKDPGALLWSARYSIEPLVLFWAIQTYNYNQTFKKDLLKWWLVMALALVLVGILMVTVIGKERLVSIGYNAEVAVGNGQWTAQATLPAYQTVAGNIPRLQSTMSGPIQFAGFSLILIFLTLTLKQKRSPWFGSVFFIGLLAVIGSFSRAAWLAVLIIGLWALINKLRQKGWAVAEIVALTIIFAVVTSVSAGLYLFKENNESSRQLIAAVFNREASDREHVQSISQSLQNWPRVLTVGYGFGRSGAGSIQNAARNEAAPPARFVDNSYLRWLEELGPLGVITFTAALFLIIKGLKESTSTNAKLLALAGKGLAIAALFTDMWLEAAPVITWLVLAGIWYQEPEESDFGKNVKLQDFSITTHRFNEVMELIGDWTAQNKPHHIVTLNPEMTVKSWQNPALTTAIKQADLVTADGAGILAGLAWLNWAENKPRWLILLWGIPVWVWCGLLLVFMPKQLKPNVERITGSDLAAALLKPTKSARLALLGSTEETLKLAKENIARQNQKIKVVLAETGPEPDSDGRWSESERRKLFGRINHAKPDVLLVAYGVPKQELVIHNYLPKLQVPVVIGISGAFDTVLAGKIKRAPQLLQNLNLEWLWRLIMQPSRLKRIFTATWSFVFGLYRRSLTLRS